MLRECLEAFTIAIKQHAKQVVTSVEQKGVQLEINLIQPDPRLL